MNGAHTAATTIAGVFVHCASGDPPLAWKRRKHMTKKDSLKRQRRNRTAWLV
eukprot:CAMPEP_0196729846 /NCGR_PEP_ID=MMETSP1091-20130531/10085_1 /TAXON_ID=302021 /ORGANISM="Rhodomonas sp., Strain CCMP768" /LENGTH=51 /DNA_ID=CAMNT_0042072767 /DNA_START=301 /DNA_END=459 /DNA_ORIENTATION=-